ncbi:MAG: aminotransferase class IV [Planctomycetales bacterium]|nr:aminotransferase class IV [Planctomycetales bacterium]
MPPQHAAPHTRNTLAWTSAGWGPLSAAGLALDDIGLLQGLLIVDRLRTLRSQPLDGPQHVARFRRNCQAVGIELPADLDLQQRMEQCANLNRHAFAPCDFSIVTLATPGRTAAPVPQPTVIVHATPIAWEHLAAWYREGQPLVVAENRNVPSVCWSPTIKTRARLQYYLAERQAALAIDRGAAEGHPPSGTVLLDLQNQLTETSAANLLIVEGDKQLVSPPLDSILNGISLARTVQLARNAGMTVRFEPIPLARAQAASELLLCGSSGCLWAASRLGELPLGGPAGPIFSRLSQLWSEELGLDYIRQACSYAAAAHATIAPQD